jgi:hypothetical protein
MCATCERPFYHLGRSPIVCPGCGKTVVIEPPRKGARIVRSRTILRPVPVPAAAELEAEDTATGADIPVLDTDPDEDETVPGSHL